MLNTQGPRTIRGAALRAGVSIIAIASALTLMQASPAAARVYYDGYGYVNGYPPYAKHKTVHAQHKEPERASKEPFGDIPKGPLEIFVSIDQQKLHVYADGAHVADTSVATGVPGLPTPLGVFSVIQKQVFHRSNIYSGAPMPFMQRITWSGVAMHEGESIGHRASHGCIRMPGDFAKRLYGLTKLGVRVIVANAELKPADFADPHLFVHKDKPAEQAAVAPAMPEPVKTAQSVDTTRTVDAASGVAPPAELGLRGTDAIAAASAAPATDAKASPAGANAEKVDSPAAGTNAPAANETAAADTAKKESDPPPANPASAEAAAPAPGAPAAAEAAPATSLPAVAAPGIVVPMPLGKPAVLAQDAPAKNTPVSVFISRKEKKLYVRQNFAPLFDVAVVIAQPEQPLGTHVFTALDLQGDGKTFRWNVVTLPPEQPRASRHAEEEVRYDRHGRRVRSRAEEEKPAAPLLPLSPAEALARIEIPQDAIDHISEMMVPGSSLIVSDHGLGDETGEGTDFIVVTR